MEVPKNRWHILSSPLKATYAGDFYAPKSNGRQETEAFKPISFDNTLNSRTDVPVYQRNWDGDGKEVVDGITHYEANDYHDGTLRIDTISDGSMDVASLYWSHVYNKVNERYANGKGFALKSGDDYTTGLAAASLFRLPKDDSEYYYYNADGTVNSGMKTLVDRTDNYQLIVEPSTAEGALGTISQALDPNTHDNNRFYIVGNPYTATLSMYYFLMGNSCFERKVWTMQDGSLVAQVIPDGQYNRRNDVLIEPMQAFFVKLKEGETATNATFTSLMTVDRWVVGGKNVAAKDAVLNINVADDGCQGTAARVVLSDDANAGFCNDEDVELLCNTDINGMPQVYTVAGDQAVALNTVPTIDFLPFGVIVPNKGKVAVELSVDSRFGLPVYVFDAKTGVFTVADDRMELNANEHGRYYITTADYTAIGKTNECRIRCFSPQGGTITVSSPDKAIKSVSVYNTEGVIVASEMGINATSCTKYVGNGIFVVKAETTDRQVKTFKLSVR